jgi:ketosteroid isomerase-like protein
MKLFISVFACSLFLSCNGGKGERKKEDVLTASEVSDFIRFYDQIWAKKDTNAMKKVMSEQYVYFTSTGSTTDRTKILGWFTPPDKYKVDTATRDQIRIVLNGNTAVVSTHWIGSGTFDGEKFKDDQRCSLVIQKINGELKVVSEHCTQIAK